MSGLRGLVFGCVSDRSAQVPPPVYSTAALTAQASPSVKKHYKVKFGIPLNDTAKNDSLPIPLVEMVIYVAQEGITTADLFRRPGSSSEAKSIMKKLSDGKPVVYSHYNFYTLASVLKKFLLKLPGGVFGPEVELKLLKVLDLDNRLDQYETINRILTSLSAATQQLVVLLFGTWFRVANHSEFNTMSSEAVAKSVAGSLFHTCADDPEKVERAVRLIQILIDDFGVSTMFGRNNLQYFAEMTRTAIRVTEKYRFEYPAGGNEDSNKQRRSSVSSVELEQRLKQLQMKEAELCNREVILQCREREFANYMNNVANVSDMKDIRRIVDERLANRVFSLPELSCDSIATHKDPAPLVHNEVPTSAFDGDGMCTTAWSVSASPLVSEVSGKVATPVSVPYVEANSMKSPPLQKKRDKYIELGKYAKTDSIIFHEKKNNELVRQESFTMRLNLTRDWTQSIKQNTDTPMKGTVKRRTSHGSSSSNNSSSSAESDVISDYRFADQLSRYQSCIDGDVAYPGVKEALAEHEQRLLTERQRRLGARVLNVWRHGTKRLGRTQVGRSVARAASNVKEKAEVMTAESGERRQRALNRWRQLKKHAIILARNEQTSDVAVERELDDSNPPKTTDSTSNNNKEDEVALRLARLWQAKSSNKTAHHENVCDKDITDVDTISDHGELNDVGDIADSAFNVGSVRDSLNLKRRKKNTHKRSRMVEVDPAVDLDDDNETQRYSFTNLDDIARKIETREKQRLALEAWQSHLNKGRIQQRNVFDVWKRTKLTHEVDVDAQDVLDKEQEKLEERYPNEVENAYVLKQAAAQDCTEHLRAVRERVMLERQDAVETDHSEICDDENDSPNSESNDNDELVPAPRPKPYYSNRLSTEELMYANWRQSQSSGLILPDGVNVKSTSDRLDELISYKPTVVRMRANKQSIFPHKRHTVDVLAVTEQEYYGNPQAQTRSQRLNSQPHVSLVSTPPSPKSLQQGPENAHRKLTAVSSVSAPDVNKDPKDSVPESYLSANKHYICTSLNRFDHVRRRQLQRMRKRSNWFLGKSSMEMTSSDAVMSDLTASEDGLSDCTHKQHRQDGFHNQGSNSSPSGSRHAPLTRLSNLAATRKDILNGNSATSAAPLTSTPRTRTAPSPADLHTSTIPAHSFQGSPATDARVRHFMVEGAFDASGSTPPSSSSGGPN